MKRRRFIRSLSALALTLGGLAIAPGAASAEQDEGVRLRVRAVAASKAGGETDARLRDIAKPLRAHPKFKEYNSFRLLTSSQLALTPGAPVALLLPDGVRASLRYLGKSEDRVKLDFAVAGKINSMDIRVSPGVPFYIAAAHHGDGILIVVLEIAQ